MRVDFSRDRYWLCDGDILNTGTTRSTCDGSARFATVD